MNTENANHDATLMALYRAMDDAGLPLWLDADTLVAHGAGELSPALARRVEAVLAGNPALRALSEALAELAPASQTLADVVTGQRVTHGHHRVRQAATHHEIRHVRRQRHASRWLGVAAALALVAVAGVWSWQQARPDAGPAMARSTPAVTAPQADAIFHAGMDEGLATREHSAAGDQIFQSAFKRTRS